MLRVFEAKPDDGDILGLCTAKDFLTLMDRVDPCDLLGLLDRLDI